jgi:hypothetical protein
MWARDDTGDGSVKLRAAMSPGDWHNIRYRWSECLLLESSRGLLVTLQIRLRVSDNG